MTTARWLIWSPHEGYNQFLVGSSELKLYEWLPEEDAIPARTQLISSIPIPNITLMMCADWSPDPGCNDLVAVGLTTGRTIMVRMNEHTDIDQSPRPYPQGEAVVSPRRGTARAPIPSGSPQISTQQYPTLPVKSSRACNVVKFSSTHPNLLAVGLDKARNESCLMVWDVSQATTLDESRSPGTMTPIAATADIGQASQVVNTWKPQGTGAFDANDRLSQAAGVYSNLNTLSRSTKPGEQRLMQQYGSAEAITSCAWLNETSAPLLIAGMGGKWLRLYDIRLDGTSTPLSIQDKAVYGLATDPFHSHRIASYTEDGVIKLWDIRKPDEAVLSINVDHPSGPRTPLSRISFSPSKRGLLASLSRDASVVDLWDIQETGPTTSTSIKTKTLLQRSTSPFEMPVSNMNGPVSTEIENPIVGYGLPSSVGTDEEISIPLLWRSRRTKLSNKSLASFSFIPKASHYFAHTHSSVQGLLTMTKDGIFDTLKIQQVPNMTWEPSGGILATGGVGMTEYSPKYRPVPVLDTEAQRDQQQKLSTFNINQSSVSMALQKLNISTASEEASKTPPLSGENKHFPQEICFSRDPVLSAALDLDISVLMRKRVALGYSMNCRKNLEIVDGDQKLKELWLWINRAETLSYGKAQIGNVDFSFQGVLGVWLGPTHNRRSSPSSTPRSSTNSPPTPLRQRISQRLPSDSSSEQARSSSRDRTTTPPLTPTGGDQLYMVQTSRSQQRYLALTICGFAFTADHLEAELVRLESAGEYDTAAGWALFNGLPDRAIKALSSQRGKTLGSSDEQQRKLMSAVLAGYQANRESVNTTWQELCKSLSEDMDGRPYLKAIFAYIASNDWSVILNMKELPLCERMAVALRILEDEELTNYITTTADELIQEGDIEGVVVTGLTTKGIDLFEKAIDRYGDIQTASLVLSFVMPKRFRDRRVEDWVEEYRSLLDRWQLWHDRANFDIERGKRMNSSEIASPQVYVRCNYCAQSLGHSLVVQNVRNRDGKRMSVQANISSGSGGRGAGKQKYTICPSCRKPLPRCALCLLHLGTPTDALRQAMASNDSRSLDPAGFDLWFTWCQTCRHGGHAIHMLDWFRTHKHCPVSDCDCTCQL